MLMRPTEMENSPEQGCNKTVIREGRLTKTVLKEGSGSPPPLHAQCLLHYRGKLKTSGEIFMDTRLEGSPARITAGRGRSDWQNLGTASSLQSFVISKEPLQPADTLE